MLKTLVLDADEIQAAREWLADCQWADIDAEDIAALSPLAVQRGIERHYASGINGFCRDCEPVQIRMADGGIAAIS